MDDKRRWLLSTFGPDGPYVRSRVLGIVQEVHRSHAEAQQTSGNRSTGIYGQFWKGVLERFEGFGKLSGARLARPGEAPYKVPVVNGRVLFPWRFGGGEIETLSETLFATSPARLNMAEMRPVAVQGALDLGFREQELTQEDHEFLASIDGISSDPETSNCPLIIVAISSTSRDLHSVHWGEVELTDDGCLEWVGFHEDLLELAPKKPASTEVGEKFDDGAPPSRFPKGDEQQEDGTTDER